jgi:electron transport complex protein RnfE
MMGLGFTAVLLVLGAAREIIGQGTLLDQAHTLFGPMARDWTLQFGADRHGLLIALLPPGAFIGLGLMIAAKNVIDARLARRATKPANALPVATPS